MKPEQDGLRRLARRARQVWPQLAVDEQRFMDYLAERVGDQSLDSVVAEDLYLACACLDGDAIAIAQFEEQFANDIERALSRLDLRGLDPADLRQALREKLFTHSVGPPKIADYNGKGPLRGWVRVTIVRMRIDAQRRKDARREVAVDERSAGPELPDVSHDPELSFLKAHYRQAFEQALAEACGALTPRERNLLRQRLSQQLTLDQMAKLHGVHRATLKRWLATARTELLAGTRRVMAGRLGTDPAELASVMRLIQSNLDVSVARMLDTAAAEPAG